MKLKSAHVTEFQSIRDSNPFEVGDITCLVGKNEAGKTAILQALYRLRPLMEQDGNFDVTDDYPRAEVEDYLNEVETKKRGPARVVTADFDLAEEEVKGMQEEFGPEILKERKLTLSKGYDNQFLAEIPVNESCVVKALVKNAQLPAEIDQKLGMYTLLKDLQDAVKRDMNAENAEHFKRLQESLKRIDDAHGIVSYLYTKYLEHHVPLFAYFDEYSLMKGVENIEKLKERRDLKKLEKPDYPLLGLIALARLNLDQLLSPSRTQALLNKLEGASNYLSSMVLKYWSQNKHLRMHFDVRPARSADPEGMTIGTNIFAQVEDSKRRATTHMGTRSRGFVWFFSFLAWFDQQKKEKKNLILLLDEPGLFLHGRAQGDLLRYIEVELKENLQVIYTTHSPFMVDPAKFERVRIVQDKSIDTDEVLSDEEDGTKVLRDVLEANEDSLFPLQGALGYDICQTLFVGPNSLVVEGVSDLLILQTVSAILDTKGKARLDERWTITPVGGADKVPTFVALLGAQRGLNIAALIDFQKKDQQPVENLYKSKLLKKEDVLTFARFTGGEEADLEDMFDVDFYLDLVNSEYEADLSAPVTEGRLPASPARIVKRLEAHFLANPLKNNAKFNHYRPARFFAENGKAAVLPETTLKRFQALFEELNSKL
jgi:predicted ATP-dependent endonuclease of OLD family